MTRIGRTVILGALTLLLSTQSIAQTPEERAGARAAAEMGVKAFTEGRWADTVDLMVRAEKLVHAPTHLIYQARAEEKLGHLVVAHELYQRIAREKLSRDAPEVFLTAQAEAKTRAEALRGRFCLVSIVVQGSRAGAAVKVKMDDRNVSDALVGVPHPVDPGEHRFEATAQGMRSGLSKVVLREGDSETVVLTLEPEPDVAATSNQTAANSNSPPKQATSADTKAPASKDSGAEREPSGIHPLKIGGFIGLGVGVVGLAVGTVFAIRSSKLNEDADAAYVDCVKSDGKCYAQERAPIDKLDSDADKAKTIATVGFVAGGIGVAAGITMLVLAPASAPTEKQGAYVVPYFTGSSAGILGRF